MFDPLQAEVALFIWDLCIAQTKGIQKILVEGDCKPYVDALNSKLIYVEWSISTLLSNVIELSWGLVQCVFSWLSDMLIVLHKSLLNFLLFISFLNFVTSTLFLVPFLNNWEKILLFLLVNEIGFFIKKKNQKKMNSTNNYQAIKSLIDEGTLICLIMKPSYFFATHNILS